MSKKLITFIGLLLSYATCEAQVFSLEDAVGTGLESNMSIRIANNRESISRTNADYAWGSFLPVIDATAIKNYSSEDVDQRFLDGRIVSREGARSESLNAVGNLTLRVFDGGAMFRGYDLARAMASYAQLSSRLSVEAAMADIATAYYDVVLQSSQLESYNETLELSRQRLKLAQDRYELGAASKVEYLTAKVDMNRDIAGRIAREEALQLAKIRLNRLLAREPETAFDVSDTIIIGERLELGMLEDAARMRNTDLMLLKGNRNILELERKLVATERFPIVDLYANYGYTKSISEAGFLQENIAQGINYGATARINILTGFDQQRRTQLSRINLENNALQTTDLEQQVLSDVSSTFQTYQTGLQQASLELENLELAKENYSLFNDQYRLGVATALEIREAQVKVLEARLRLDEALYQVKVAEIELARLSGQLLD